MIHNSNDMDTVKEKLARRGRSSSQQRLTVRLVFVAALFYGVIGQCSTLAEPASMSSERDVASLRFPQVSSESDEDDIIKGYAPYLHFVIAIGNETDAQGSKRLLSTFQRLAKKSPAGAALFLKGLRYEMIQKVELSGWNPSSMTTNSVEMRQFVSRYLSVWTREADEQLFRAYSNEIARRHRKED